MNQEPTEIAPDTKDWTHVIHDGCAQCGFDAGVAPREVGVRLRATIPRWEAALSSRGVRERPDATTWSPLEYGCHVRDVCRLFLGRLDLMLTREDARFENWDQDATAVEQRYWERDPRIVATELAAAAAKLATRFDAVTEGQWERRGVRSNGSEFTVATLGVYLLHDVEHHLHDVGA